MIKLESKPVLSCTITLDLVSDGDTPSIQLTTSEYQERVADNWVKSHDKVKQEVVFITSDGPVTLSGIVHESRAVEIAAAYRVVIELSLQERLKGAFDKGRVSQAYVAATVIRVLEVYDRKDHKVFPLTTRSA